MMNVHKKLEKVRKPRVHISYDLEDNGASIKKELPFVVGVLGEYSGDNKSKQPALKDRKFIQIDGENFDEVLARMQPGLQFKVQNTLKNDGSELAVDLTFNSMDDFNPDNIAKQIEPLRKLLEAREKLYELQSKADRSETLEIVLETILKNDENLKQVAVDLNLNQETKTEENNNE